MTQAELDSQHFTTAFFPRASKAISIVEMYFVYIIQHREIGHAIILFDGHRDLYHRYCFAGSAMARYWLGYVWESRSDQVAPSISGPTSIASRPSTTPDAAGGGSGTEYWGERVEKLP